ncbi:cold shock domain-containing protein CspD [Marinagarivorans cellulosilyticus]|uniref:Cold shock-like protein CspD n=1 Tax=Marinagarivorans cellulosilyticus TaxID=2721545 RepID=A0AAN1WJU9_9GAMM|nr:cold shock domain-containing protein CspD [Marinagarivorans cellulosilyticus]BCD98936.1 cold shock protein [Marinagarivorans cellulosilyticus]
MPSGIVKWFNNAKGFGFILSDENSEDIFAHYSAIEMDGFRTLKAGQSVVFDLQQGEKGLHAANIRAADEVSGRSITPTSAAHNEDAEAMAYADEHEHV